jgi:hypothetical protein
MSNTKSYDRAFLTGADHNTEWMLPWFFENYKKYNDTPIVFADFGVIDLDAIRPHVHAIMNLKNLKEQGWFKKPKAMMHCPAKKTVWIDTDCQVKCDISDIFDLLVPGKLCMVEDKPWTARRGERWYNSGVVGFADKPRVLFEWAKRVQDNPEVGDQETLHAMLDPIGQLTYIEPLPNEYNWLRLQIENDGQPADEAKVVHWTGQKGKDRIRSMMNA